MLDLLEYNFKTDDVAVAIAEALAINNHLKELIPGIDVLCYLSCAPLQMKAMISHDCMIRL
jgi:hypothetical protein